MNHIHIVYSPKYDVKKKNMETVIYNIIWFVLI